MGEPVGNEPVEGKREVGFLEKTDEEGNQPIPPPTEAEPEPEPKPEDVDRLITPRVEEDSPKGEIPKQQPLAQPEEQGVFGRGKAASGENGSVEKGSAMATTANNPEDLESPYEKLESETDWPKWQEAIEAELVDLEKHGARTDRPEGANVEIWTHRDDAKSISSWRNDAKPISEQRGDGKSTPVPRTTQVNPSG
jgi:hypothetical protein